MSEKEVMSLLDQIKTSKELRLYLESLTNHVLHCEKRIGILEAKANWLEDVIATLEDEISQL